MKLLDLTSNEKVVLLNALTTKKKQLVELMDEAKTEEVRAMYNASLAKTSNIYKTVCNTRTKIGDRVIPLSPCECGESIEIMEKAEKYFAKGYMGKKATLQIGVDPLNQVSTDVGTQLTEENILSTPFGNLSIHIVDEGIEIGI